jgi:hypothetical protein
MSRTSTTDSQKEARALSSIEAVSDGGGQFVDSALDASRFAAPRGGGGGSKGTGDTGGEGLTLPPGEGSILPGEGSKTTSVISGIDFGSLKNRIASAIDHAVHPQDGSETYEFFFLRRKVSAKKKTQNSSRLSSQGKQTKKQLDLQEAVLVDHGGRAVAVELNERRLGHGLAPQLAQGKTQRFAGRDHLRRLPVCRDGRRARRRKRDDHFRPEIDADGRARAASDGDGGVYSDAPRPQVIRHRPRRPPAQTGPLDRRCDGVRDCRATF